MTKAQALVGYAQFIVHEYGWALSADQAYRLNNLVEDVQGAVASGNRQAIEQKTTELDRATDGDQLPDVVRVLLNLRGAINTRVRQADVGRAATLNEQLGQIEESLKSGDPTAMARLAVFSAEVAKAIDEAGKVKDHGTPCPKCGSHKYQGRQFCECGYNWWCLSAGSSLAGTTSEGAGGSTPITGAGTDSLGVSSRRPAPPSPEPRRIKRFHFSAFYPEKVGSGVIGKIVASVHAEAQTANVVQQARHRLDLRAGTLLKAGTQTAPVPSESVIRVTPDVPGLQFDISEAEMSLWSDAQSVEFRFRPHPSSAGQTCRGWVHFWLEGMILADVPVIVFVEGREQEELPEAFRQALAEANAGPYRAVFPSYSHADKEIVERLETYAAAFGDEYLRDVHALRAGQAWNAELLRFIEKADVFQLFWSHNAAKSPYVKAEWQHALEQRASRPDPHFIRPVYWASEPAPLPLELQGLEFARVPL